MTSPTTPPPEGDLNKAPMLRAVICSELTVATIVVGLRFFTRLKLIHSPGMDDWIMLATFVCAVVGSSMDLAGMEYGIGRHVYYLDHPSAVYATKLDWLCQAFVISALTIGKVSVAFFILRLSNTRWHFYFLHTVNITLLLINVPLIIWTYAQCKPTALLWDPKLPGRCQDPKMQGNFAIFQGSYGAATDLLYALFPILILWNLQIPRRRKVQLSCIMCLGVLSAAAGAFKTYYLQQLRSRADFTCKSPLHWPDVCKTLTNQDIDEATSLMIWYTTEMYVIIIAGSLPTLRPLVQKSVLAYRSYKQRSSRGYHSHPNVPYELRNYPAKKAFGGTGLQKAQRKAGGHSDEDVLASAPGAPAGITKTMDFSLVYAENDGNKRTERWEDIMSTDGSIRADERV